MTQKEAFSYVFSTAKTISCGNGAWAANGPTIRSCMPLSSESLNCRIEWRPSRLLCLALVFLGAMASVSLWLSALPFFAKLPSALLASGYGAWLARRERDREVFSLCFSADGSGSMMAFANRTQRLSKTKVMVRGPLARVSGVAEDGRTWRLLWWPDTLPAPARRALRLASSNLIAESGPVLATISG